MMMMVVRENKVDQVQKCSFWNSGFDGVCLVMFFSDSWCSVISLVSRVLISVML